MKRYLTLLMVLILLSCGKPAGENPETIKKEIQKIKQEIVKLEKKVKDLESVEKKMERLTKIAKSGDKDARRGLEVLAQYKAHLEDFQNARTLELADAWLHEPR